MKRDSYRRKLVTEEIKNVVLEDEDYKRHIKEVAVETGLPEEAVSKVLSDFFLSLPAIIYTNVLVSKKIIFYSFFKININRKKTHHEYKHEYRSSYRNDSRSGRPE